MIADHLKIGFKNLGSVLLLSAAGFSAGQTNSNSFYNWESPPVHPVALSPDKTKLAVCNLPDNRLELFDVTAGKPAALGSVSVGLDPVSVRFRNDSEIWVVNFISDSVTIVDLATLRVVGTISTLNEPADVVFAGTPQRAFICCAQPHTVQVLDPATFQVVTNLIIEGNRPKAMATSPDGGTVYVAIFESGNSSTIISTGVSQGVPRPSPVSFPEGPQGGQDPPPNRGTNFVPVINPLIATAAPPRVGLIVKKNKEGRWMDDNRGDWTEFISGTNAVFSGRPVGWDMPDHDLAVIDAASLSTRYVDHLMNICMDVAVNPVSGKIGVVGTEALNQLRFEPVLDGIFVQVHLALLEPGISNDAIVDLNSHLDYLTPLVSETQRNQSIGDPRGMVWSDDGSRAYVSGMGSDNLIIIDSAGGRIGREPAIALGQGPTGLAVDDSRHRLYVLNRFAASISTLDTTNEAVVDTLPLFDPTPQIIKAGRKHLYDTHATSGLGQAACASCHLDARFDRLAWDLGNPAGTFKLIAPSNINFGRFPPAVTNNFHPMKGPMTTQTLQDIIGHEPFHWRGDRDGLEQFNATFTNLQGAATGLTTAEMQELKDFLSTVRFPPNPFRQFDNTLSTNVTLPDQYSLGRGSLPAGSPLPNGNAQAGLAAFRRDATTCIACHTLPSGVGTDLAWNGFRWLSLPLGTNAAHHAALIALPRSAQLPFKIAQLRNLYDKLGTDFSHPSSRAGFGFFHDGSVDTLVRFVQDGFDIRSDQDSADIAAFLFSFSGSDLPEGSFIDILRPPGLPSKDTPAAVGRQTTINSPARAQLIDRMIALASASTSRVDLVVKGMENGLSRGWLYDRTTGRFLSDRATETSSPIALRALAGVGSEQTYTLAPAGSGRRIGIDRDEDGYLDRDELDFGSDPANPLSLATNTPPILSAASNLTVLKGTLLTLRFSATDKDIPAQLLSFSLGPDAPAGASINSTNGILTWTPSGPPGAITNSITVTVTDNGSPNRSDSTTFAVVALDLVLGPIGLDQNGVTLSWGAMPGRAYRIQYKTRLDEANWVDLPGDITAADGIATAMDFMANTNRQRFYRVFAVP